MIRMAALRERITLVRRADTGGAVSDYGDPIMEELPPVEVPAAVQPLQASEDEIAASQVGQSLRTQRYHVLVAPDAPVDGLARVEWRGRQFEVIGEPLVFPTNGPHHIEFDMTEVLGG